MTRTEKTLILLAGAALVTACAGPRKNTNPGPYGNGYSNGFAIDGVSNPGGPGREGPAATDREQDYQRQLDAQERERREEEQERQEQQRERQAPPTGTDRF